jgi:hypothetical protein
VRNRARTRLSVVAAIAISLALLASACSSDDDDPVETGGGGASTSEVSQEKVDVDAPGVSDSEIRYSILATGEDPTGACVLPCFVTGIQAYFDYVNTEQGGVYGRQLVAEDIVDDEFSKNQQAALEIIAAENTFGTFAHNAIGDGYQSFADEEWPLYIWATNPVLMKGNESIFGEVRPRCLEVGCWDRVVMYQMKVSGKHKLASIGYGIAQSSKDCANNTAQSVAQAKDQIGADAEAVYVNDNLAFGTPNGVAPEVTAMKNAGANIMSTCIVNNDTKALMQEAKRQGLDIVPVMPQGYNEDELAAMGGAFDGGYLRNNLRSFEADLNEAQQAFLKYTEKNGGQQSEITYYGWINAALAVQGLLDAGPDFSREKVIAATNQLTAFTAGGLVPPQDWSKGHEPPTAADPATYGNEWECYSIMKIVNSKFELVGDKADPFNCWPADTWQWTDGYPESKSFE